MTKEFKKRMLFLLELDFLNGQIEKLELEKEELRKQFSLNGVVGRSEQLFCGGCGRKRELKRYSDLNSGSSLHK